jgi:hypothetical protein
VCEVVGEIVEPVQDGGFVAEAEVEGDQVSGGGAGSFGGSPLVLVGLEPGGVDGAVAGEELGDLLVARRSVDTGLMGRG